MGGQYENWDLRNAVTNYFITVLEMRQYLRRLATLLRFLEPCMEYKNSRITETAETKETFYRKVEFGKAMQRKIMIFFLIKGSYIGAFYKNIIFILKICMFLKSCIKYQAIPIVENNVFMEKRLFWKNSGIFWNLWKSSCVVKFLWRIALMFLSN